MFSDQPAELAGPELAAWQATQSLLMPSFNWELFDACHALYHFGNGFRARDLPSLHAIGTYRSGVAPHYWRDPEEFVERIERAATAGQYGSLNAALKEMLQRVSKPGGDVVSDLWAIHGMANTILAASCCQFLAGADASGERWSPYQRWARTIERNGHDRVVTFNYDAVPEMLELDPLIAVGTYREESPARIFKLHGSTTWRRIPDGFESATCRSPSKGADEVGAVAEACLAARSYDELAIVAPGTAKMRQAQGALGSLWAEAERALSNSRAVFIIGYRMPETDAAARTMLTRALKGYSGRIQIVLGADTNHPDPRRLAGILRAIAPSAMLDVVPMFSQDFLAICDRDALVGDG